jgi:predicted RND superfamily exporter protein
MRALTTNANSPLDWVDSSFKPRAQYDRFSEQFGAGDVVVLSWPGCTIRERRLDELVHVLRHAPAFQGKNGSLFHSVISGRESLAVMIRPPLALSYEDAARRMQGWAIGPDGQTTCLVIGFNHEGLQQRGQLVPLIRAAAVRCCGANYETLHMAGPIIDGYAVDRASQTTMNRFAPLSSIISFCVCLLCLESLFATCLVFGISLLSQAIALSILHYSGGTMTALLIVLPPLVQVLAIAGGIHLVNYYFDAAETTSGRFAIAKAIRIGWLPCVLSSATTAIGLGSLAVSGLVVVRDFGVYAALSVIATLAALLVFLPGVIAWWPVKVPASRARQQEKQSWSKLTDWQERYGRWTSLASIALMVGLGFGVARLEASVRIETLFASGSRVLEDYAWLEENVGTLVPIEVVASFTEDSGLSPDERLDVLRRIENRVFDNSQVTAVTSCLSFLPHSPMANESTVAGPVLEQAKPLIKAVNYCALTDGGTEQYRTTAHVSALGDHDYGQILRELETSLTTDLADDVADGGGPTSPNVSLELSGLMPLVHEIQEQLLQDLFASFLLAFALIAVVMTIVQAGLLSGLLSMIPNVFPALTLFGILGWIGHPVDIGSIMTASLAMGIAVDDTLHFLTFFQRTIADGATRRESVLAAYEHCGRAMIQTTLVCGSGLAIFCLSDFVPTARFSWMMVALLAAALVGDLIILPALLLSPIGKVFDRVSIANPRPGNAVRASSQS